MQGNPHHMDDSPRLHVMFLFYELQILATTAVEAHGGAE